MKSDTPLKLEQKFSYIESLLAWKGEVCAGDVAEYFQVARQTAQGFITAYKKHYPAQMEYDSKRKRHLRSQTFKHDKTKEKALLYLDFIRGQTLEGKYWNSDIVSEVPLTDVDRLGRPKLCVPIVRAVLTGLATHRRVSIRYQSKDIDPKKVDWRMISPNHLVHADNRYHVRAYSHKSKAYRDFVLSRIQSAELQYFEEPDSLWVSGDMDRDWTTSVILRFKPHADLTEAQVLAVTDGFDLDNDGCFSIETNQAQAFYVERRFQAMDLKLGRPRWSLLDRKEQRRI